MTYNFSRRINELKPSAIREILKVTQDPTVISFAAGNPSVETFPAKEMAEIAADMFANRAGDALQYGVTEGYNPLRDVTAKRLREKYNVGTDNDDLIIVTGGQQGMDLTAKAFLNEDDVIICENPSFIGSLNCFRSYKAKLVGIPLEFDGMDMNVLEETLKQEKNVKLIYVIPTFQNPTGRVMSLEKRRQLLEIAKKYDVMIIEDNPYFELRYSGEYVPTIKSMDTEGRVIYVGSYSKILSPGIRLGFVCAPKEVISKLTVGKQVSDVHTNLFFQMLAAEFLTKYDLDAHIEKIRDIYRAKRDAMVKAMDANFGGMMTYEIPDGGLFMWGKLDDSLDGAELCKLSGKMGVVPVPGSSFLVNDKETSPCVRFNFSLPTFEQIDRGMELMGQALKEYTAK